MSTRVDQHSAYPRHRPAPLATRTNQNAVNGATGVNRAQILSSLRTARPAATPTPQQMAAFELQQQANYQYLALQQQILLQQQQMILAQQQQQQLEAEAAMRAMRLSVGPSGSMNQTQAAPRTRTHSNQRPASQGLAFDGRTSSLVTPEDEAAVRGNPLAASALARRKRQSFSLEPATSDPVQQTSAQANRRASYTPIPPISTSANRDFMGHHRRASSTNSVATSQRDLRSPTHSGSTDTPAVILSAPGEAFPSTAATNTTASSDGGESGVVVASTATSGRGRHARRYSVEVCSHKKSTSLSSTPSSDEDEGSKIAPWLEGIKEASHDSLSPTESSRRPSQADQLAAALGGPRPRPVSINGPPSAMLSHEARTPGLRSVSDSIGTGLSPFATTFQPLPASPFTASPTSEAYTPRASPPLRSFSGGALQGSVTTAIRQPKGPEADLGSSNFATRLRKRAIATLLKAGPESRAVRIQTAA